MRFAVTLALCLIALPAWAGFKLCNHSPHAVKVALGYFDGTAWTSRGWWTVTPKTCQELVSGPLQARYYYVYANDGGAGSWDGHNGFCVAASASFVIKGRADCEGHGYDRKGFFGIDTGQARDYTQTLSD